MQSCNPHTRQDQRPLPAPAGASILGTVGSTGADQERIKKFAPGADLLIQHGIPWLGKKAVEAGRYYASEAMRNPKLQKKAIDFALDKLNPIIKNVGSQALNQLSTKFRPKKKYKTNGKDLDGGALAKRRGPSNLLTPARVMLV